MDYSPGLKVLQRFTSEGRGDAPSHTWRKKRKKATFGSEGGKKEAENMVRKWLRRALEQGCVGRSCDGAMPEVGSGAPVLPVAPVIWVPALGWLRGHGALPGTEHPWGAAQGPAATGWDGAEQAHRLDAGLELVSCCGQCPFAEPGEGQSSFSPAQSWHWTLRESAEKPARQQSTPSPWDWLWGSPLPGHAMHPQGLGTTDQTASRCFVCLSCCLATSIQLLGLEYVGFHQRMSCPTPGFCSQLS